MVVEKWERHNQPFNSVFLEGQLDVLLQLQENKQKTILEKMFIVLQSHNLHAKIASVIISTTDSKKVGEPKH